MTSSIKKRAASVEAIVFDVDGVLTGGEIIHGPDGEWKIFNVKDGHGFVLARKAGLKIGLLTARRSAAVRRRAAELKVDVLFEGAKDKGSGLTAVLSRMGVTAEKACYVGDDLVDLPAMAVVGLPVAVADAVPEVRLAAGWVTKNRGGKGAAREVVEGILKAKGIWRTLVARCRRGEG